MLDLELETETGKTDPLIALAELEKNTSDAIRKMRAHERITLKTKIIAEPGNLSQRREFKLQGVSGDVSEGGCCILFPMPLSVGDVYLLTFDRKTIDVSPALARCMRCRLMREDAFECGFSFFSPLDLSDFHSHKQGNLLD